MGIPTDIIQRYEARKKSREPFPVRPGMEVRVHTTVREGDKERTQVFEGIVIGVRGAGLGRMFTVRRVTGGVGVERIFPVFSPLITDVEIVRATSVRRAKLTYLRVSNVKRRKKEDHTVLQRAIAEREAQRRAAEKARREAEEKEHAAAEAAKAKEEKEEEATDEATKEKKGKAEEKP